MTRIFLFTAWLLSCTYTNAQTKITRQLDTLLSHAFTPNEPGIVALVAKDGQVIYEKAFGSANLELNVPLQPNMVFRVGSVTKQFTAAGILKLAEQGKLSLSDSLQQYIRDFPPKGATITIRHLLTHTSGLKEYTAIEVPDPYIERHDFTAPAIIDHFKQAPLEFAPGSRYSYSNSNYVLLARIIEVITGDTYQHYITENVIKPAGLLQTGYAPEKTIVPLRVTGYTRDNGFFQHCDYQAISLGYGCGDLLSTAGDLNRWNNALLAGKVLSPAMLKEAYSPYRLNDGSFSSYGYGWIIDERDGRKCIHHEGQTSGFIASERYYPDEHLYVVVLTNVKSGEDKTSFSDRRFMLFSEVAEIALGDEVATLSPQQLNDYTGVYQAGKQTVRISVDKDRLICKASMEGTFALVPVSRDKFKIAELKIPCTFQFVRNQSGAITEFISLQRAAFDWLKTTAGPATSVDALRKFTGRYQLAPAPGTWIRITEQKGVLMLSASNALPDAALLRLGDNSFKYTAPGYDDMLLEFVPSANGAIEKLIMLQGPVHCRRL
ncbi:serine hydrolase domain-containing protein [Chitinophaga sp. 212800010-3]|uniref:serine hydrolase domain-containing protein n=1 Tax=unclassified Chitinophaga TaxID=2619133 RepID=UPI002DE392D1|nr:Serine hydrolase [Chitinophaga sp. 212800010-3]